MHDLSGLTEEKKVHFYVPDFYNNAALYMLLVDFLEHIPQWFYGDFDIAAAYGTFPNCIWNGGRTSFDRITRPVMDKVVEELNKRGIAVRFTFTNPLLEEKHMSDIFGNICLEAANNGKNEVLVNTQVIEDYVRKNYPDYKIISSTTKIIKNIEGVEAELDKDYYLVVLDSSLNTDPAIFNIAKRDKLEVLVDHCCQKDCPNRSHHYNEIGRAQLTFNDTAFKCPYSDSSFEEILKREHSISRDLMVNKFIPGGFKHFKLDGRVFPPERLVDSLLYYMVLPEHQARMKEIIKKEVYANRPVW